MVMYYSRGNGSVWPGIFIAIGLFLLGFMIKLGIGDFISNQRVVTVKGLAEREVAADRVIWPLMYKVVGNDLYYIYNMIDVRNRAVMDFLRLIQILSEEKHFRWEK